MNSRSYPTHTRLTWIYQEQSSNRLDQSSFPYLGEAPADSGPPPASLRQGRPAAQSMQSQTGSLRSARPTWHKAPEARQKATTESRQRFIIFVAGGLTYSERRMAYLIGDALNKEVIIGEYLLGDGGRSVILENSTDSPYATRTRFYA